MLYSCNRIRLLQRLKHATPTAKVLGWNPPKAATTRLRQEQGPWPWSGHETRPALVGSSPHGVDGQQPPGSPGVPQVPCRSKRTYASGLKCCLKQLCPGPALIIGCCHAEAGNLAPGASDETTPHSALHGTARNGPCAAPHPTMPHSTPIHYTTRQDTALRRCTALHYTAVQGIPRHHCTTLHCKALHNSTALHSATGPYTTRRYNTSLQCTALQDATRHTPR